MLHNLRIQQRFVAILLLPLVLAAGRIRLNVTEGVRAGRVNTLVIFTITLAGLAHELQKERDLSAVYVGNPSSGPQNVIVQRQLVDQVLVRYQARIGEANAAATASVCGPRWRGSASASPGSTRTGRPSTPAASDSPTRSAGTRTRSRP